MKILKFGGTSVGSAQRIKGLLDIVNPADRQIIVLAAVAGTTNALVEIGQTFLAGKSEEALDLIAQHKNKYEELIKELFSTEQGQKKATNLIDYHFNNIGEDCTCPRRTIVDHLVSFSFRRDWYTVSIVASIGLHENR